MKWTARKQQYCDEKNSKEQTLLGIVRVVNVSKDLPKIAARRVGSRTTCLVDSSSVGCHSDC